MKDHYYYLEITSLAFGWIYFIAWSISFYPQGILNWQKKSVAGFSIEFAILNVSGFFFYALYSVGGYFYQFLGTGDVQLNDLVFALHAFFISSAHLTQVFIYDRGEQHKFKSWTIYLLVILWTIVLTIFGLEGLAGIHIPFNFNAFRMSGYGKAIITLVKFCPQVYLNYKRKSTVGWSIFNIMCDFTGGVFSILQEFIDYVHKGKTTGLWDFFGREDNSFNLVKFSLGVISIVFDLTFMFQHFYLYPDMEEATPLLHNRNKSLDREKSVPDFLITPNSSKMVLRQISPISRFNT
mmetsp:Transcript_7835/g.8968  ORF Transcript_7835/g.8968 Transcript_7835/m.8968 type:complete len:294 (+) Transcript_7835:1-882(+)